MTSALIAIANDGMRIYAQVNEDGKLNGLGVWGEMPGVDGIFELESIEIMRNKHGEPADYVSYTLVNSRVSE